MTDAERAAGHEIYRLAQMYGLRDAREHIPMSRYGTYVGTVNGHPFSCDVYDLDPIADLRALQAALGIAPHQEPAQLTLFAEAAE